MMIFDFLIGIGLSIYLIYIIPNEKIQSIIIPIVASIYGGLLTLIGVAWTIKKSERDKKEEERAKAVPLFTFNIVGNQDLQANGKKVCLIEGDGTLDCYAELENSDRSVFYIRRVFVENSWHIAEANNTVLPNNKLLLQIKLKDFIAREEDHPVLEIEDVFGRKYYYDLFFARIPAGLGVLSCTYTLMSLKEISKDDIEKRDANK